MILSSIPSVGYNTGFPQHLFTCLFYFDNWTLLSNLFHVTIFICHPQVNSNHFWKQGVCHTSFITHNVQGKYLHMKDTSKYLLNFIEMNLLGMRMTLTLLSITNWPSFHSYLCWLCTLVSDPRALAIGFVIVPSCQKNRKNLFFSCSVQSALLFWSGISSLGMIAFEEENFYGFGKSSSCSNCIFNHHCLPLQCVCPFPKPGLWILMHHHG